MREIALVIADDAPRRAKTYVIELQRACRDLRRHPKRFELALKLEGRDVRRRVHGRHVILYSAGHAEVFILRIVDGARDYPALLREP